MKQQLKDGFRAAALPVGRGLARIGVTANAVTIFGLFLALPSAYAFWIGEWHLAFWLLLVSSLSDLFDGAVARASGGSGTVFGAALDSSLDRYGEGVVFTGILLGLARTGAPDWLLATTALAGTGSFLVSYVRARAEGLGLDCEVGILERTERLVLLMILALIGPMAAPYIMGALAFLSHVTFIQRLAHVRRTAGDRAIND